MEPVRGLVGAQPAGRETVHVTSPRSTIYDFFNRINVSAHDRDGQRDFVAAPVSIGNDLTLAKTTEVAQPTLGEDLQKTTPQEQASTMVSNPIFSKPQDIQKVIKSVKPIEHAFTSLESIESQRIAHQKAKEFLIQHLTSIGAEVRFISPPTLSETADVSSIEFTPLLAGVFYWENTLGVAEDIQRAGLRSDDNIVLYGAASQFNGCEAPGAHTIHPGEAAKVYRYDRTQGPQAQLQFHPYQVELINCGGNLGFNGLCNILNEETKAAVAHGYFRPTLEDADAVIQALTQDGIEYMCVANRPYDERKKTYGAKPVHMTLMSAPAFGYGGLRQGEKRNQIEFLCALQGFRAQFQHCIDLAQKEGKPVIFNAAGMGLGVYGNDAKNVAKGFYVAAKEFEAKLQENNVQVRFQVFRGIGNTRDLANMLNLTEWTR